jgi:hypothetical protein
MTKKGMLGKLPLSEIQGPRDDLEQRLAGDDGEKWLAALKRFLRKENPWPEQLVIPRVVGIDSSEILIADWVREFFYPEPEALNLAELSDDETEE